MRHDDNRHQYSRHITESLYHTIQAGSRLRPLVNHTEQEKADSI